MRTNRHKFPANWPAPENYLVELGRMTALWGLLESTCVLALGKLAGYSEILDIRIVILTAHSNFQQRVVAISAMCEHLLPIRPQLQNYELIIKLLKAAQKTRNKYTHNGISTNDEIGEVVLSYATARGSLKLNTEVVHLADIKEACSKIHEAQCSLYSLITETNLPPIWERRN